MLATARTQRRVLTCYLPLTHHVQAGNDVVIVSVNDRTS